MKKALTVLLFGIMIFSFTACAKESDDTPEEEQETEVLQGPVELNISTTWGGNDGNKQTYLDAVGVWQKQTGNVVNDSSGKPDETFKARVITDFEVGAEPDVLFYFSGSDSDPFVLANKVVSIEEIRTEYPDYASNMKDDMIQPCPADGKKYAVPAFGYWEGMYVNKNVLKSAGVELPSADYTWDAFLADCQKIKDAGFSPIAAALANVPHYWFEFAIYNQLSPMTHAKLPENIEDENGQAWINGLADIKDLYEKGYFPANTLSATDDETFQMFIDGKAAFLIDGSWKAGGIEEKANNIENFTVTYIPAKGERKATDIIGGLSCGYYITRKAWDDPEKRDAAVAFVQYMTSDKVVSNMAAVASVTALTNGATVDESKLSPLKKDCLKMLAGATGITNAVQDSIPTDCRLPIFDGMPQIVKGEVEISDAVQQVLDLIEAEKQ